MPKQAGSSSSFSFSAPSFGNPFAGLGGAPAAEKKARLHAPRCAAPRSRCVALTRVHANVRTTIAQAAPAPATESEGPSPLFLASLVLFSPLLIVQAVQVQTILRIGAQALGGAPSGSTVKMTKPALRKK